VIRIRVTESQRLAIEAVAAENDTSVAGVIRDAVDDYVADYREKSVFRGTKRKDRSHNRSVRLEEPITSRQATCATVGDNRM